MAAFREDHPVRHGAFKVGSEQQDHKFKEFKFRCQFLFYPSCHLLLCFNFVVPRQISRRYQSMKFFLYQTFFCYFYVICILSLITNYSCVVQICIIQTLNMLYLIFSSLSKLISLFPYFSTFAKLIVLTPIFLKNCHTNCLQNWHAYTTYNI